MNMMKCKKLQGEQESGELTHRSDSELAEMIFFFGMVTRQGRRVDVPVWPGRLVPGTWNAWVL
jgi:hypothetical protein